MTNLHIELINEHTKTLDKDSKWFNSDIEDFRCNILKDTEENNERRLSNLKAMGDPCSKFNKDIDKEVELMDKEGMYNIGNMHPKNALD